MLTVNVSAVKFVCRFILECKTFLVQGTTITNISDLRALDLSPGQFATLSVSDLEATRGYIPCLGTSTLAWHIST